MNTGTKTLQAWKILDENIHADEGLCVTSGMCLKRRHSSFKFITSDIIISNHIGFKHNRHMNFPTSRAKNIAAVFCLR